MTDGGDMPQILEDVLELVPETDRRLFASLFQEATDAMAALGELDLTLYEDETPDDEGYGVWDRMAPVVAETQNNVHALLQRTTRDFPAGEAEAQSLVEHAARTVAEFAGRLKDDVEVFRDDMRQPRIMADRWELLRHISAFRGRARSDIGSMIFNAAGVFAKVHKADVIPYYHDDLEIALSLRRALAQLTSQAREIDARIRSLSGQAELAEAAGELLQIVRDFAQSEPYGDLRVIDRRVFAKARDELERASEWEDDVDVAEASRAFYEFLTFLGKINERETLVEHDTDVITDATTCLRDAREALRNGVLRARVETQSALRLINRLQGRSAQVDSLIAKIVPEELMSTQMEQLMQHIGDLERILSSEAP